MRKRTWLVVFVGVLVGCTEDGTDTTSALPEPVTETVAGMSNTVRVDDLLFGGQPSPEALRELGTQGYKTLLSTRGHNEISWDEKALADSLGLQFVNIPMDAPVTAITDAQVAQFANLMKTGKRPMILHCGSGNRVAGLWAVWLVEYEGLAPVDALRLGKQAGMTRVFPAVQERLGQHADE